MLKWVIDIYYILCFVNKVDKWIKLIFFSIKNITKYSNLLNTSLEV